MNRASIYLLASETNYPYYSIGDVFKTWMAVSLFKDCNVLLQDCNLAARKAYEERNLSPDRIPSSKKVKMIWRIIIGFLISLCPLGYFYSPNVKSVRLVNNIVNELQSMVVSVETSGGGFDVE